MSDYKLSVRLMTYNHERFIDDAMKGILMQKVNFCIEVVVGDDFSTDNTLNIIKQYKSTDNIHIKILKREVGDDYWKKRQEKGRLYNFVDILNNCSGKYIALLDGDDYWTDPFKLQKQVDFLERNPDYAICFHRMYDLMDGAALKLSDFNIVTTPETYTIEDLAKGNFIHTPSIVFRNFYLGEFPKWLVEPTVADYPLHMINASHGKIKYLPEPMGVYRKHAEGAWSTLSHRNRIVRWIKTLEILTHNKFEERVTLIVKEQKTKYVNELLELSKRSDWNQFVLDLGEYALNDQEACRYWLTTQLPQMVIHLRNSKSFRLAQKISKAYHFFFR